MSILRPDRFVQHFSEVSAADLKKLNIDLYLCDIDNTLVAHDAKDANEAVKKYIQQIREAGIEVVLISNNYEERVATFAKPLELDFFAFAQKPLKKTYKKIIKKYPNKKIACIGDQILTDVLGGNRMKFYTIKSKPLVEKDLPSTKINRFFERLLERFWKEKK